MYINSEYDINDLVAFVDVFDSCIRLGTVQGIRIANVSVGGSDKAEAEMVYIVQFLNKDGLTSDVYLPVDRILNSFGEYASCNDSFEKFAKFIGYETPRVAFLERLKKEENEEEKATASS